jgi:hypothetical protein
MKQEVNRLKRLVRPGKFQIDCNIEREERPARCAIGTTCLWWSSRPCSRSRCPVLEHLAQFLGQVPVAGLIGGRRRRGCSND